MPFFRIFKLRHLLHPRDEKKVAEEPKMNHSNDTVKREYQNKLGEEFGSIFHALMNDWCLGKMRIEEFRLLFGNVEDLKLLNAITGGGFLYDIQKILWDDLMLRLSRMTDPARSAGKENLTVQRLPELCKEPKLRCEVDNRVKAAVESTKFARDWRNRRISHADLARAISPDANPLDHANIEKVGKALDAVHAVLECISIKLLKEHIWNDVVIPPRAGAFVAHTKQLAKAVQYIDSAIDPTGNTSITDSKAASEFLRKIGCRSGWEEKNIIFELREAARMFR